MLEALRPFASTFMTKDLRNLKSTVCIGASISLVGGAILGIIFGRLIYGDTSTPIDPEYYATDYSDEVAQSFISSVVLDSLEPDQRSLIEFLGTRSPIKAIDHNFLSNLSGSEIAQFCLYSALRSRSDWRRENEVGYADLAKRAHAEFPKPIFEFLGKGLATARKTNQVKWWIMTADDAHRDRLLACLISQSSLTGVEPEVLAPFFVSPEVSKAILADVLSNSELCESFALALKSNGKSISQWLGVDLPPNVASSVSVRDLFAMMESWKTEMPNWEQYESLLERLPSDDGLLSTADHIASLPENQRGMATWMWVARVSRIDTAVADQALTSLNSKTGTNEGRYELIRNAIRADPLQGSEMLLEYPRGELKDKLIWSLMSRQRLTEAEKNAWINEMLVPVRPSQKH